jgi:hypothetical protein
MGVELKSNNPQLKWKRWDVRADGMVFWGYWKKYKNGQYWVTLDQALKLRDHAIKAQKLYRQTPKAHGYKKTKKYKIKQKKYIRDYNRSRRRYDPMFAMIDRLRSRIRYAIRNKGYSKTSKTSEMLGCDWNHLMTHLEEKFVDGMTWGNRHLWHIDHITPLASATSEEELIKLNHYTNLQPLWAEDNLRKGNRICANVRGTGRKPS